MNSMVIAAPIPVFGRMPLFPLTFKRLIKVGVKPVAIVERLQDKKLVASYGIDYIEVKPMPLGMKWNLGFKHCERYNPDAVLFVGSSDWVSDNWCETLFPFLEKYDLVGKPDIHYYYREYIGVKNPVMSSLNKYRHHLGYWAGYHKERKGEPIGGGRMLSRKILDELNWKPFYDNAINNMDFTMLGRVIGLGGKVKLYRGDDIQSLALATNIWSNKHNFGADLKQPGSKIIDNPEPYLQEWFPEALKGWNAQGVY